MSLKALIRPDLRPLIAASKVVGKVISKGDIVVYESTVYPGVTEEECLPVVERVSGLKYNVDFFAGYSPEDPVYFPEPDWESWTEVAAVNAGITSFTGGRLYSFAFAAVRKDGTVLAAPVELAEMIGSWQDMKQS